MPTTFTLPSITIISNVGSLGNIRQILRPATQVEVVESTALKVGRRTIEILTMSNGERVVVGSIDPALLPQGTCVLKRTIGGSLRWSFHPLLMAAESVREAGGFRAVAADAHASWQNAFQFTAERLLATGVTMPGLRPPQVGALHAIGAHWSLTGTPATVVMPTGTGKTETMLGALTAFGRKPLLVVVPSRALRDQTARKFFTLGLLRDVGVLPQEVRNPVVGILTRRPRTVAELNIFEQCNVVLATVETIAQGTASALLPEIARHVDAVVVDEAHHVAARTWRDLREAFVQAGKAILQFTATPFRRDGQAIEGKTIYNYPLARAQAEGYFKPIRFRGVFQLDSDAADRVIAREALEQLGRDLDAGFDHILMARCSDIPRAEAIWSLYKGLAPEHNPLLVHSRLLYSEESLAKLRARSSRIVICVDMLGEGFDLPQLKIAALHDAHKSLAVLMQFIGRFTRTSGGTLGDATVIANTADQQSTDALDRLFTEDADWNRLLSDYSSAAIEAHVALTEFLRESVRLGTPDPYDPLAGMAASNLAPKFSTAIFRTPDFNPEAFHKSFDTGVIVRAAWINAPMRTLFFITEQITSVPWTKTRALQDRTWNLFVVHQNPDLDLLFVHSTDKESLHQELASTVAPGATLITGDSVFRAFGGVRRLKFQNVGLRKRGRRTIRFSMHTGADVGPALSPAEAARSTRSNFYGLGFEHGEKVGIGCSIKGRIWSRRQSNIKEFTTWCAKVGQKVLDESITTEGIIGTALQPEEVAQLPDVSILSVEWPDEVLTRLEDLVTIISSAGEHSIDEYSLGFAPATSLTEVAFFFQRESAVSAYTLRLEGENGYDVVHTSGDVLGIKLGATAHDLARWLTDYPPAVLFVDGSELEGCILYRPRERVPPPFPLSQAEAWDWSGVDIRMESRWKDGEIRPRSIQQRVINDIAAQGFDVVFDDDGSGEAADLVCMKEEGDLIKLILVHCKFSSEALPGARLDDVVEVTSQAVRSGRWVSAFSRLCRHLVHRSSKSSQPRFVVGDLKRLNQLAKMSRFKEVTGSILIVQPGVSRGALTDSMLEILASANGYLLDTAGVRLDAAFSE